MISCRKGDDMALRQYRPDHYQYEESVTKEQQIRYQAYETTNPNKERLKELIFFVNIVLFSILTVFSAYSYLSIGTPTIIAFALAIITGFIGLRLVRFGLQKQHKRIQQKKRRK